MRNKLFNLLLVGLFVFIASPVFSATCPSISGSTNCAERFFCGGKCLSQEELKNVIGKCSNFNCGSCSCNDGFSLPQTPAYLNVDNNVGYLKLLDFLMIYQNSGNNAELKLQSTETENSHWGIYHDRGTKDLRFWNVQSGNNLILGSNGDISFGGTLGLPNTIEINSSSGKNPVVPASDIDRNTYRFWGDVLVGDINFNSGSLQVPGGEIKTGWLHVTRTDGESTFANKVNIYDQLNVVPDANMPIASLGGLATGNRSIAMIGGVGGGSQAKGAYSFSAGASALAEGDYSVALGGAYGSGTQAKGNGAFAAGGSAIAEGIGAVAIGGSETQAKGNGAFAAGGSAVVNGYGSVALGDGNVVGMRSFAFNARVSGDQSIGLGLAVGSGTIVNGSNSILVGNGTLDKNNVTVINSPSGLVGINNFNPTSALDVSGHIKSNSLEVKNFIKLTSFSKGNCDQSSVGKIVYEEVNNIGNFYGCVRTSLNGYIWKQLDN